MQIPTVTIVADTAKGFRVINASDFDPARHQIFGEPAPDPTEAVEATGGTVPDKPEDIDNLAKPAVRALLDAHGVDVPKGSTVAQMRSLLCRVMFMDD